MSLTPPLPPPPPPPPPLTTITEKQDPKSGYKCCMGKKGTLNLMKVSPGQRAYEMIIDEGNTDYTNEHKREYFCFSHHQKVDAIIQSGPQCGVVSLAMAMSLLELEPSRQFVSRDIVDQLMSEARMLGYTNQGEMLSTDYMISLLQRCLSGSQYEGDVLDTLDNYAEILTALYNGNPLLVPYDTDKNYCPCLKNGHKAHWALVAGFFVPIKKDSLTVSDNIFQNSAVDEKYPCLYKINKDSNSLLCQCFSSLLPQDIWVYAYHGKSKYPGIWSLKDLIDSNRNLHEFDPERVKEGGYVIPEGGIERGLCNKIILIKQH